MATRRTRLSAPTRSTGIQRLRQKRIHLPPKLPGGKKTRTKSGECSGARSGNHTSSECCAAVEDVPSSSTGKCKKGMAAPPATKKVSAKEDGTDGTFTISATLDSK